MAKRQRVIHTRGNAAETPNWRFSLSTSIARKDVPELCQGLAFIVGERKGGSYYYPDYVDGKTAAAFEWYRPYRRRIFGYKIGVEFWIEETNLEKLGVYVLYGEDHYKSRKNQHRSFRSRTAARPVRVTLRICRIW